jgi:hypothetical protein
MKDETTAVPRARHPAALIAVLAIVAAASFAGGFWTSRLMDDGRVRERSEARFREFLATGIDLGFVAIDRQRLDEIEVIRMEADWEERDALDRGEGGTR